MQGEIVSGRIKIGGCVLLPYTFLCVNTHTLINESRSFITRLEKVDARICLGVFHGLAWTLLIV